MATGRYYMPTVPIVRVGQEKHTNIGPCGYLNRQHTLLELLEDYWSYTSGLLAVNIIGTILCEPINSGLPSWRLSIIMEAVAENKKKSRKPRVSNRLSKGVGDEWVDAGQDGQTCVIRLDSTAQTGAEENISFLVSFP